jgi:hypothetical protein
MAIRSSMWYINELKRIVAILERTYDDLSDSQRLDVIDCAQRLVTRNSEYTNLITETEV